MPYQSAKQDAHHGSGDNGKDNAWSTEMEHHDAHDSDDDDRRTERGGNQEEDEYALLHSTETDEGRHPGRPLSWGDDHNRTGYPSAHDAGHVPMPYAAYNDNSNNALSPGGYDEYRDAAPVGAKTDTSYGGSGKGYSFGR